MVYDIYSECKKFGAYGEYHKWNKNTGIKIIVETKTSFLDSISYRLVNKASIQVFMESIFFNLFYKKNKSKVVICRKNGYYYLGIMMPHFSGKKLSNFKNKKTQKGFPLILEVLKKYSNKKMISHDIHEGNFLIENGEIKIIDFSPELIQFYGKKADFKKELKSTLSLFKKENYQKRFPQKSIENAIIKKMN